MHQFVLYLHVLAVVIWIGGIIFLTLMGPLLRVGAIGRMRLESPFPPLMKEEQKGNSPVNWKIARRFRNVSWIAVLVLVVTGMANLAYRGWVINPVLLTKLILVGFMIIIKILHDFIVGPKVGLYSNTPLQSALYWKTAFYLGRLNLLLGLVVLYIALLL